MTPTATSEGRPNGKIAAGGLPDFGKFILDGIPYQYDDGTDPILATGQGLAADQYKVLKDGPAQGFGDNPGEDHRGLPQGTANDVSADSPPTEAQIRANPFQSIWWYFDGTPHRVTKAMRFEYTVTQGGASVVKHILIGYEGVDGQG